MGTLTISKKEAILTQESRNKFHAEKLKLNKDFCAEAEKIIKKSIPKHVTKKLIDEGWLNIKANFSIDKYKEVYCIPTKISNYYPVTKDNYYGHKITPTPKLEAYAKKIIKLEEERDEFGRSLRGVLNGYKTSKALLLVLPELAGHFENEFRENALVPVEQINKVKMSLKRAKK